MLKESKSDRFIRIAEARVNKLIKMIRLLGNCSRKANYEFTEDQVCQMFSALYEGLHNAHTKYLFSVRSKMQFSLSDESEETEVYPHTDLALPDGTVLRATAVNDENFPAINICLLTEHEGKGQICFVEYNPERSSCHKVCIGVYRSDKDETVFYEQYVRDQEE